MAAYRINRKCHSVQAPLLAPMAPLIEERHSPHKKEVLITIRVGFDLLKSNLLCDYTPSAYSHFTLAARGFLSSDQPCKSMSRQFTNQAGICDSRCPSRPQTAVPPRDTRVRAGYNPQPGAATRPYLKHQLAASE